jgi:hypothetical protein
MRETHIMTLNEAVDVLRTRRGTMHDHAAAGAYVHSYYTTEGRHLLRSFPADGAVITDSIDRKLDAMLDTLRRLGERRNRTMTRDQPALPKATASEVIPYERGGQLEAGLHGAQEASERPAGARRIMRLPYASSAYVIMVDARGETWLCFTGEIDNAMDPGVVNHGSGLTNDMRREIAADAARSNRMLREMNAANRKAWGLAS